MATINHLSNELLEQIFSHYVRSEGHLLFLRNISCVCKHWNDLTSLPSVWKSVGPHKLNQLQFLSQKGLLCHAQSLKVDSYDPSFSYADLSILLKSIRNLKALYLVFIPAGRDTLKVLAESCPHLERLRLDIGEPVTSRDWDNFLSECGPRLKYLQLKTLSSRYPHELVQQLLLLIASKCPLLEGLMFSLGVAAPLPIHELREGCPRLRELEFHECRLIAAERNDFSLRCGFKELKKFVAIDNDFRGMDICELLNDSMDLEHLKLDNNKNMVFGNISKRPTNKLVIQCIGLKDTDRNIKSVVDAASKCRHSLYDIDLYDCVLRRLSLDDDKPQLQMLVINNETDPYFLDEFIQKCRDLISLQVKSKDHISFHFYKGPEAIKEALELFKFLIK